MTRTKLIAILLVLLAAIPALGNTNVEAPLPGEALYLIVLGERPSEPDVAAMGGRLLRSWSDRRLVAVPANRAGELQALPGVSYIQRVWTGEPFASVPSTPEPRFQAQGAVLQTNAAPPAWTTGVYQYDPSGNIKAMGSDSFRYDAVGRVIQATVQGQSQSYTFDPYGNLLQLGDRTLAVEAATNRLEDHDYDAVGNMTVDADGRNYKFDALGMVTAIDLIASDTVLSDVRMIYTADDERIVISEGPTTRYRLRDLSPRLLREWTSTTDGILEWERDYIYAGGDLVAGEVQTDQHKNGLRHYHKDHLGSIRMVTDGAGELVARHDYLPFGAELPPTTTEFTNTGVAPRDPLKFTGHERDYFSGANLEGEYVDYMHARYYAPKVGRFLSVDPGKDWDMSKPQSWNMYTYVRNNPVNGIDPTGRQTRQSQADYNSCVTGGPCNAGVARIDLGTESKVNAGGLELKHEAKITADVVKVELRGSAGVELVVGGQTVIKAGPEVILIDSKDNFLPGDKPPVVKVEGPGGKGKAGQDGVIGDLGLIFKVADYGVTILPSEVSVKLSTPFLRGVSATVGFNPAAMLGGAVRTFAQIEKQLWNTFTPRSFCPGCP